MEVGRGLEETSALLFYRGGEPVPWRVGCRGGRRPSRNGDWILQLQEPDLALSLQTSPVWLTCDLSVTRPVSREISDLYPCG